MNGVLRQAEAVLEVDLDRNRYSLLCSAHGKRGLFVFKPGETAPHALLKSADTAGARERCATDYAALEFCAPLHIDGVRVPKPLGQLEHEGTLYHAQEAVRSGSMNRALASRPSQSLFSWVTTRLIALHQATRSEDGAQCLFHGDCWTGNLGRLENHLVLYDFECARPQGKPLFDLIHFCLFYAVAMRNAGKVGLEVLFGKYRRDRDSREFLATRETAHHALIDDNPLSKIAHSSIGAYLDGTGIGPESACELLREYVEVRREIEGLPDGWAERVIEGISHG